jgi:hypothetical protein
MTVLRIVLDRRCEPTGRLAIGGWMLKLASGSRRCSLGGSPRAPRLAFLPRCDRRIIPRPILRVRLALKDSLDGPLLATFVEAVVRRGVIADGRRLLSKRPARPAAMVRAGICRRAAGSGPILRSLSDDRVGPARSRGSPTGFPRAAARGIAWPLVAAKLDPPGIVRAKKGGGSNWNTAGASADPALRPLCRGCCGGYD